jgi:hypothetical protein
MKAPIAYLAYVSGYTYPAVIRAYTWEDARDQAVTQYGSALVSVRVAGSTGEDAYVAGLRRAQELARELSFEAYGEELHILAPELIQAIDAEAAKERG